MTNTSDRIAGYDVARALAIFGMVVVNFQVSMMGVDTGEPVNAFDNMARLLHGRAAATFVVLAGVGLSLMCRSARASGDPIAITQARVRILRRAVFLFVIGLVFLPLWSGDILHYYGIFFAFGAALCTQRTTVLWTIIAALPVLFVALLIVGVDYSAHWNWETLEYESFWTIDGLVRHTFINGFHPVIPWLSFLCLGIWIGRRQWDAISMRWLTFIGLAGMVLMDIWSEYGVSKILEQVPLEHREDLGAILGIESMPPSPFFMFSAGSAALGVIGLSLIFVDRLGESTLRPLIQTGQLALTHYLGHVILGLGTLEALGWLTRPNTSAAERAELAQVVWLAAGGYIVFAVVFSVVWCRFFRRGPLEWIFRRLAS